MLDIVPLCSRPTGDKASLSEDLSDGLWETIEGVLLLGTHGEGSRERLEGVFWFQVMNRESPREPTCG